MCLGAVIYFMVATFVLGFYSIGKAQELDVLEVLPPDPSEFPHFSTIFRINSPNKLGRGALQLGDLAIYEGGEKVALHTLEEIQTGVHFTLVINGGREFDVRDAKGVSPYMQISPELISWVERRRFKPEDTLSLVVQEGALVRNTSDRNLWNNALQDYKPNFRTMIPNLTALETALNLAEERVVPFGVEKVVLYITPPPTVEEIYPLASLAEFARNAGISINVWMLRDTFFQTNDQGEALMDLAAQSGGAFYHFSEAEGLPDPETYLADLGTVYQVFFDSQIREAGTFTVKILANLPFGKLEGESHKFIIDVLPPKPVLLSPPAFILRQPLENQANALGELLPSSQLIEFLLEFPDHHARELKTSMLIVDGRVVDQRSAEPFSPLIWDLTEIEETGKYVIQVKVEDALGMIGETIVTPIQVEVHPPEPAFDLTKESVAKTIIGVILGTAIILFIFWLLRCLLQSNFAKDVLTKRIINTKIADNDGLNKITLRGAVTAAFQPLGGEGLENENNFLIITKALTIFGSDPQQVDFALEGEEISPLHARLSVHQGTFWLWDLDSEGGTWVDYEPVGTQPRQLNWGNIIHFGNLGFRFTLIDAASQLTLTVEDYEPLL